MNNTNTNTNKFPPQIKYIIGNEACERFSYYGMRAILVVFMTQYLKMAEHDAKGVYHLFISGCYLMPLFGAFVSDRFWGKYKTIMLLSIVYCLGHLVLSLFESKSGLMWGLALIAIGSGGIKPCVSAHVGDQFTQKNAHLLEKVFSIFYFSINFGAFFSSLLIPLILPKFGPSVAFGIPGILMAIATVIFWMGKKYFIIVPPVGKNAGAGFFKVLSYSLSNFSRRPQGKPFMDVALDKFKTEEVEGAKAAFDIFKLFFWVSIFWALFDQQGSSWTLQATKMDLNFMGMKLEPSQIQALNPIMVLVLIPFFSAGVYPFVEKLGVKVTPLRKMSVGMLMAGLSFVMMGVLQTMIDGGAQLNVGWQFIPYLTITASEVMVSITGLEFAYTQAPRAMKSTLMSFWLLTVFFGNLLAAYVSEINKFTGSMEFYFYAGLMFAMALIFTFVATRYKERSFMEKEGAYSH